MDKLEKTDDKDEILAIQEEITSPPSYEAKNRKNLNIQKKLMTGLIGFSNRKILKILI